MPRSFRPIQPGKFHIQSGAAPRASSYRVGPANHFEYLSHTLSLSRGPRFSPPLRRILVDAIGVPVSAIPTDANRNAVSQFLQPSRAVGRTRQRFASRARPCALNLWRKHSHAPPANHRAQHDSLWSSCPTMPPALFYVIRVITSVNCQLFSRHVTWPPPFPRPLLPSSFPTMGAWLVLFPVVQMAKVISPLGAFRSSPFKVFA
jgi:hypothetical protein